MENLNLSTLLTFAILLMIMETSVAVGPVAKKSKKTVTNTTDPQPESNNPAITISLAPESRSLQQWIDLGKEVLVLSANAISVQSTGTADEIAQRLFDVYQRNGEQREASSSAVTASSTIGNPRTIPNGGAIPRTQQSIPVQSAPVTPPVIEGVVPTQGVSQHGIDPDHLANTIRQEVMSSISTLFQHQDPVLGRHRPLDNPHPQSSHPLPPIPAPVLERIRRGEFVNFDLLLPNNVPSEVRSSYAMSLNSSDPTQGPTVVFRDNNSGTRNRVTDLHSWFLAWSLFFHACLIFRPHIADKMEKYQCFISKLAS